MKVEESHSFWKRLEPHPPRPPKESASKAGRNLPAAVITAVVLLAIVALSIAFRMEYFVALATVALVIAMWEATGAFLARDLRISFPILAIAVVAMVVVTWFWGLGAGFGAYFGGAALLLVEGAIRRDSRTLTDSVAGTFVLAWIGIFALFAIEMAKMPSAPLVIIAFILLPVANDTGGWLAGVLFGKHPIAPSISPKKSWEGFLGSQILSLIVSLVVVYWGIGLEPHWAILVGVLTPVFATLGDFSESLIKRDLGVKDMGSIFPGHGGMLDRLDSILFCAPLCYVVFALGFGIL